MSNKAILGQTAYEAYRYYSDGKSLATDQKIPKWEDLPEKIQTAWIVAAGAVAGKIQNGLTEAMHKWWREGDVE